jgi:ElaB/YqjD/DUF883 family membrane-anchored ribosome-binding protein
VVRRRQKTPLGKGRPSRAETFAAPPAFRGCDHSTTDKPRIAMRANGTALRANKELIKEISALRTQLKKLSTMMNSEAESGVNRALGDVKSKSKEVIDSALGAAQDFIDQYADGAREALQDASQRTAELRDSASESLVEAVKARPFATAVAIAGISFLAGFLFRRSRPAVSE